jgi:lipoprotein NlpI
MNAILFPPRRAGLRPLRDGLLAALTLAIASGPAGAAEDLAALLRQAQQAFLDRKREEALALATRAIEAEPTNAQTHFLRGRIQEESRQFEPALADYNEAIRLDARAAGAWHFRGTTHFRLGRIDESVADFDRFLELSPDRAPHHWQRGIALYYAGRYEDGRKQFELHQTVNRNDVENTAWHFLCTARLSGVARARKDLLLVKGDRRVPMMEVQALYAGKGSPEAVLAAARAGNPPPAALQQRLFYAHLYLGLYYEATRNAKKAAEHIKLAATDFLLEQHYMGDVARVHAARLDRQKPGKPEPRRPDAKQ